MIVLEQSLNKILKGSSDIVRYPIHYYGTCNDKPKYAENVLNIINELRKLKYKHTFDLDWVDENDINKLSSAINGFGEIVFENRSSYSCADIVIIFDEDFAVEFELYGEHELYGDPTLYLKLHSVAIKDGKTLEDVKEHIAILRKLE